MPWPHILIRYVRMFSLPFIVGLFDFVLFCQSPQARIQDFLKGGGDEAPWTLSAWRYPLSALQNFVKHPPLLDIHKHPPPPWTLSAWRHPPSKNLKNTPTLGHSQAFTRGDRSRSRTLCIGFQYQDKFKGGGGWSPLPPRDPPLHHSIPAMKLKLVMECTALRS